MQAVGLLLVVFWPVLTFLLILQLKLARELPLTSTLSPGSHLASLGLAPLTRYNILSHTLPARSVRELGPPTAACEPDWPEAEVPSCSADSASPAAAASSPVATP